ncbi:hypothetical protein Dimus_018558, partial [Dionaea muscipula]
MAEQVEANKSLTSYGTPSTSGTWPPIIRPTVAAASFEINPAYVQIIQNNVQ